MRIAFFIDDYLPSVHGVATSTAAFRRALEDLGHEVFIVAPKAEGHIEHDDHIIRLSSSKYYVFDSREMANIYPGLAKRFDAYDFDVVHSQTQFSLGVLAHSVAKRQGIPHVTTIHTLYTELIDDYPVAIVAGLLAVSFAFPVALKSTPVLPRVHRDSIKHLRRSTIKAALSRHGWRLTAAFANKCDACLAPSQHLAQILIHDGGLSIPCTVLPNGIDTAFYRHARAEDSLIPKEPGQRFIICVARLSPEKRQIALVESLAHLPDPVRLILVGGGPSEAELRRRAEELGVAHRVVFAGMLPPEQVATLLKQADVFALASYHFDNQPMVFLEASAAGLPIVYCDERMTECLTERNAVLASGITGEDLARAFNEVLGDEARLESLRSGALEVSQDFDVATAAGRLIDLYTGLIEARR
ncbi:glycosyltransferase [Actinomyces slackii]|uniref:GDP-mannose-dependent alpha-(1-6)-phosphatidylinositol monomannoside mannosyltransferase n=1 Tax=Actinomyces slackii TaxID=52774 RepID=A0A448KDF9_9ACTO|nr:glycosyltransferase [Actinomyces slackii]VEG74974.1 GDP-mannose-dependent alpha-(1-6)-phosphatidylinositol monomannoside mannosyltransferase [Actinomyces slackii]